MGKSTIGTNAVTRLALDFGLRIYILNGVMGMRSETQMTREEAISKLHGLIYGVINRQRVDDTCREVIDYLKAQEPKVMTLSGVRNLKESTPVWLEDVDKKDVIGALFTRDYSGTKCVDFAIVRNWEHECVTADYMDYGIRWRVWTSRPTDEVRRATPWN